MNHLTNNSRWQQNRHWLYALLLPLYLLSFFIIEQIIDSQFPYTVIELPLDKLIPFCEWFFIPYVLWYPFMLSVGIYLGFKEPQNFKRYMTYFGIAFLSSIIVFMIFPNGQDLRPDISSLGRDNLFTRAIASLYQTDTNTNVCPSLHVVGSMMAVFGVLHSRTLRRTIYLPILSIILAILIILSTMFIKQHSVVDVFVGIPYGLLCYIAVYWLPQWLKPSPKRYSTSKKQ